MTPDNNNPLILHETLVLNSRRVCGQVRLYPVCEVSRALCALTGRKTFFERDLALLKTLGFRFDIEETQNP